MNEQHILLVIFWIAYGLIHSAMAASVVKQFFYTRLRFSLSLYRIAYNFIAIAGLLMIIFYQFSIETVVLYQFKPWMWIAALLILVPGIGLMFQSIFKYFRQMSGISMHDPELVTSGAHRFIRHPLYAGTFLFIIGLLLLMPTLANLVAVVVIITYTLLGIRFEEKKLIKQFGDNYIRYRQKVPMIIPKIKR